MIKKVHHTSFQVSNIEKEIDFYKSLGFDLLKRFEKEKPKAKAAYLQKENIIEIWQLEDEDLSKKHIAFETDDLQEELGKFIENGFEIVTPITSGVTVERYAFVKDGNGNYFELFETKK